MKGPFYLPVKPGKKKRKKKKKRKEVRVRRRRSHGIFTGGKERPQLLANWTRPHKERRKKEGGSPVSLTMFLLRRKEKGDRGGPFPGSPRKGEKRKKGGGKPKHLSPPAPGSILNTNEGRATTTFITPGRPGRAGRGEGKKGKTCRPISRPAQHPG